MKRIMKQCKLGKSTMVKILNTISQNASELVVREDPPSSPTQELPK
jgi:energy-coupling factor transporter ATP-binding protein EcfA2